jgi:hypothetical protein
LPSRRCFSNPADDSRAREGDRFAALAAAATDAPEDESEARPFRDCFFWQITEDALAFAFKATNIDLNPELRAKLTDAYVRLKPWPDDGHQLRLYPDRWRQTP